MPTADLQATLSDELARELTGELLPYWQEHTVDVEYGGFVGRIVSRNRVMPRAPKAVVLNTRILWAFSAAARMLDGVGPALARRAYAYVLEHFWDERHGGLFWMLDHTGASSCDDKRVYAQAFGVYALTEYYRATGDAEALARALQLFRRLERHTRDPKHGGYFEAYSRDWQPHADMRLSERDPIAMRSMNTHLHVLEAYTALCRVWPKAEVRAPLRALIETFLRVILNPETDHLGAFFDEVWQLSSDRISYGHDIEASWLLTEAADVLGNAALQAEARQVAVRLARATLRDGLDSTQGLINETNGQGVVDADRHWWPQAEAIVGFFNAYELTGDPAFLQAAAARWAFIKDHLIDREHGEWLLRVSADGTPYQSDDKVGPWKGPYHSVRTCLEIVRRTSPNGEPGERRTGEPEARGAAC